MTGGVHHHELAVWYVAMHVLANGTGSDHIVGALQDQRRRIDGAEIPLHDDGGVHDVAIVLGAHRRAGAPVAAGPPEPIDSLG